MTPPDGASNIMVSASKTTQAKFALRNFVQRETFWVNCEGLFK